MTIKEYIQQLNATLQQGKATEHSYRPHLQGLLTALLPGHSTTNEPKRIACGAPDYIISARGSKLTVAFIEAKDIGDPDLDGRRANREQFDRYKEALENLIFTDYLDFHVYQGGEFVDSVRIGELKGGKIVHIKENEGKFMELVVGHIRIAQPQGIASAQQLAQIMAGKARLLAQTIDRILAGYELDEEAEESPLDALSEETNVPIVDQFKAFRHVLIHDLSPNAFADLYAQTITYGLFAARINDSTGDQFTRQNAATLIPQSNPFLRQVFQTIATFDLDPRYAWIVDDLATTFNYVDTQAVMHDETHDPIIHFYEDFLTAYDPDLRKTKGVWYTPQSVVSFIVRAVDEILIRDFGLAKGLADSSTATAPHHRVQILDPATGTGTFLAEVVRQIHTKFKSNKGAWQGYVEQHLLPRLYGFELLMAPYAIAHLNLESQLRNTGYTPPPDQTPRIRIYLTDALENEHPDTRNLFASWLSREANAANAIKRIAPVMVMLGNPPYNGASTNKSQWIMDLMQSYKTEPGGLRKLDERNPKWLNDDYVKFIRMGQHYIERNPEGGVLAFITPHGYLDNPTFRGMRWQLLRTFDTIYLLDLHGNARKRETTRDGGKDENVFDIMQGVSIGIFVSSGTKGKGMGCVFHHELLGTREDKFAYLDAGSLGSVPWQELQPRAPQYFFVPKDFELEEEYQASFAINELIPQSSVGIVTTKDAFLICDSPKQVERRIRDLIALPEEELRTKYGLTDTRDWSIARAKADVGQTLKPELIRPIGYRPFDTKFLYYTGTTNGIVARPRFENFFHLSHPQNLALICKLGHPKDASAPCFVSRNIIDFRSWSSPGTQGGDYAFPLYHLESTSALELSMSEATPSPHRLVPNLNPAELSKIEQALDEMVEPLQLFDYIYATLHSLTYRERYKEFLKIDFPRIPYPTDRKEYLRLVTLGGQLRALHLMENAQSWPLACTFPVEGDCAVEAIRWADGRVYINDTQHFEGVPKAVWELYIGGYQPAQKWLKDRKAKKGEPPRCLSFDDIEHYARIVHALGETIRLMAEIG
ncbi:MAG: DNA methyltransferase [Bacteroidia bacterium]|nr:MAG: DNA methyltransferase [Bacteroidia bacterium]